MPSAGAERLTGNLVVLVCFAAAGIVSQAQELHQVSVAGQVTTEGDQAIAAGVRVVVETTEGWRMAEQPADSQGRFQINNLPSGRKPYRLTVTADGYYPVQEELDLRSAAGTVMVRVVLTRISKAKQPDESLPELTAVSVPHKARKAFEKGMRALQAHQLPDAQRDFSEAVAEYPCYARAQTALAAVLVARRDLTAAEAALRKAIQCDPGFADGFASLGRLLNSEKRFAESEEVLQQGLRLSPNDWELYDQLAAAHHNLGSYSRATEEWLRAMTLNPQAPSDLHAKLAAAYLQQGNSEKAYAEFQAYLRADPEGRFAPQAKRLVRYIESSGALRTSTDQAVRPLPQER
jgi:tetratricopeptide (TPR) repeat protein